MMYKWLVLLTVLAVQKIVASTTSDSDGKSTFKRREVKYVGSSASYVTIVYLMPCGVMYMYIGGTGENECVSQQELAAVKAELADTRGRVDTLQSQLNYWQNVTINILKDLYFSPNSGNIHNTTKESHVGLWPFCTQFQDKTVKWETLM